MKPTPPPAAKGGRRWRALPTAGFMALSVAGLCLAGQGAVIPAKAVLAQVLLERAFAKSRSTGAPVKAWPWADAVPVARISVPRLGVSEIILSGGSGEALAFGPTLVPGSARLGQNGTAVIAAHRDTHFSFMPDLQPGDVVVVETTDGDRASFRMQGGYVVRNDRFAIASRAVAPTLVLSTCWPFDATTRGPWRYVAIAHAQSSG
ncbi:Sortase family protein [compost metagenome]